VKAKGKDCEVRVDAEKVIIDHPGGMRVLRRLPELWREGPQYLMDALNGPSKAVLMEALGTSKDLLTKVIQSIANKIPKRRQQLNRLRINNRRNL
jgi:hypothetical protein